MAAIQPTPAPIDGRFVRLEPFTRDLVPEVRAAIAHPEVFAAGYGGGPAGLRETEEGFTEFAERYYRFDVGNPYVVRLRGGADDGTIVGTSTLTDFEPAKESAHLGWTAYDPRVWGTVVNPETKLLLLGLAFESGFGRVKIQADAANTRSRAAIAKLGATFEGITRRDQTRADGTWRDAAIFSILVDEWPDVRAGLETRVALADAPVELRR